MAESQQLPHRRTFVPPHCLIPQIVMLGWSLFREARYVLAEHSHPGAFEICYIRHGKVDWWAEDRVYQVGPGDIYITHPNERHGGVDALMHPCELYWILFSATRARGQPWSRLASRLKHVETRLFPGTPVIPEIFEHLLAEHQPRHKDSAQFVATHLQWLILEVLRAHEAHLTRARQLAAEQSPAIHQAMDWMAQHAETPYALEEAADASGLGISQFHARFRRETGFAPGEYRTRLRLEQAKLLLRQGELPVTRIAHRLGFSSSQYFATTFRRYIGLTPRAYRQRVTERA